MRKTALLASVVAGVALALLVLASGGGTARADNGPHVMSTGDATPDKCAGCHRLHTGQSDVLLKQAGTIEDFCYTCHGNGGTGSVLAVQEGTYYGGGSASSTLGLRAGGFDQARINTQDSTNSSDNKGAVTIGVLPAPATVNSAHAIDGTTAGTVWGNGAIGSGAGPSLTLDCTSCHDPHGNGNYRILRGQPVGPAPTPAPYNIPDTYPKTSGSYAVANYFDMGQGPTPAPLAAGSTPVPGQSILVDTSRFCAQCHTRYLATRQGTGAANPTPTPAATDRSRQSSGDAIFNYRHTSSGVSISGTDGTVSFVTRACITCHAGHGSNSSMPGNLVTGTHYSSTVPWPGQSTYSSLATDTQRASLLKMDNRGMCKKCHGNK